MDGPNELQQQQDDERMNTPNGLQEGVPNVINGPPKTNWQGWQSLGL
jgi:hypothetical protein